MVVSSWMGRSQSTLCARSGMPDARKVVKNFILEINTVANYAKLKEGGTA